MRRRGKPRAATDLTISSVLSVEPESTTMISASPSRLAKHLPMQASSFLQMTVAEMGKARGADVRFGVMLIASVGEPRPGVRDDSRRSGGVEARPRPCLNRRRVYQVFAGTSTPAPAQG